MTHRVVFLLVGLGLVGLVLPSVQAADDPDPAEVATWILEGDTADVQRAIRALEGAPASYLAQVVQALRKATGKPAPPLPSMEPESEAAPRAAARRAIVHVEFAVWSLPPGAWDSIHRGGSGMELHYLDDDDAAVVREALRTYPRAELLQAPRILVEDGETAEIDVTEAFTYVKGVRSRLEGGKRVAEHVLDTVRVGLSAEVRPTVSDDREHVTLEIALEHTGVKEPIPVEKVRLEGIEEEFEVQRPVVFESPMRTQFRIPDGGDVAITGLRTAEKEVRDLVVLLHAEVHAPVPELVDPQELFLREAGPEGRLINLEARFLEVTSEVMEDVLGVRRLGAEDGVLVLDAKQVLGLLGKDRGGAVGVTVMSAPRLTTYEGQEANVSMLNQTSYIQDYEVERGPGGPVLDPIIGTVQDGLVLDVTARVSDDRKGIRIDATTTWADVTRPIPEVETVLEGQTVTIQIPELRVSRGKNSCLLPPGGYVLLGFGGHAPGAGGAAEATPTRCVLLNASVLRVKDLLEK